MTSFLHDVWRATSWLVGLWLAALSSAALVGAAAPEASSLFPAGGQLGQSVRVALGGNVKPWPVSVWSDDPRLTIEADKQEGMVTIQIGAEVEPGVHWLRFYNADGSSPPRPFVVGRAIEVSEKDPNNERAQAQPLESLPVTINGKLNPAGDLDTYRVELQSGQTLVADVDAERPFASPVDMIMQIVDPSGFVLAQNNDDVGLDPRLVFTATKAGPYLVRVYGYSSTPSTATNFGGGENFIYRLTLTTGAFIDYAFPLARASNDSAPLSLVGHNLRAAASQLAVKPAAGMPLLRLAQAEAVGAAEVRIVETLALVEREPNALSQPQQVTLPVVLSGRCDLPGDVDAFEFVAKKGARFVAKVEARSIGFPTDPVLLLYDEQGTLVQSLDDAAQNRDCELAVVIRADGRYRLVMRDLYRAGSSRHAYLLSLAIDEPDYTLTLAGSEYPIAIGKTLEIPVTVDRRGGFAEEIKLEVQGLPPGIQVESNLSAAKGDTAKSVKLKIHGAKQPFTGALQIVGRSTGDKKLTRTATLPWANRIAPWSQLWLTVTK